MKIEEAHTALRLAASDEIVSAVIELHRPVIRATPYERWGLCGGCDQGPHAEDIPDWPCTTISRVNEYLHVDLEALS